MQENLNDYWLGQFPEKQRGELNRSHGDRTLPHKVEGNTTEEMLASQGSHSPESQNSSKDLSPARGGSLRKIASLVGGISALVTVLLFPGKGKDVRDKWNDLTKAGEGLKNELLNIGRDASLARRIATSPEGLAPAKEKEYPVKIGEQDYTVFIMHLKNVSTCIVKFRPNPGIYYSLRYSQYPLISKTSIDGQEVTRMELDPSHQSYIPWQPKSDDDREDGGAWNYSNERTLALHELPQEFVKNIDQGSWQSSEPLPPEDEKILLSCIRSAQDILREEKQGTIASAPLP